MQLCLLINNYAQVNEKKTTVYKISQSFSVLTIIVALIL